MKNPLGMIGKAITNKVMSMDMADIGKMAAGALMIIGGVVVMTYGNVGMNEVNEAIAEDLPKIDVDVVETAVEPAVETVEAVVEATVE